MMCDVKYLSPTLPYPPPYLVYLVCLRYRWAFVPEVNVTHYSGPETALIENEQDCTPHVVRILEGIQQRYGVRGLPYYWKKKKNTFINCIEPKAACKSIAHSFAPELGWRRISKLFFIFLVVVKHLKLHFTNERCYINKN